MLTIPLFLWIRTRKSVNYVVLRCFCFNNNNNSYDNIYGAGIMAKVIARVHPVHLMNVDWALGGRQPSDQASRLRLLVRRKLAAIIHIHHRHCYYNSASKLILILPSHEGWKPGRLSRPKHCSKGAQPVQQVKQVDIVRVNVQRFTAKSALSGHLFTTEWSKQLTRLICWITRSIKNLSQW